MQIYANFMALYFNDTDILIECCYYHTSLGYTLFDYLANIVAVVFYLIFILCKTFNLNEKINSNDHRKLSHD